MSSAIAEFFVALGVDLDEKSIEKADKAVSGLGKTLTKGLAVGLAAATAAAAAGVGVLLRWTNQVAQAGDDAAKTAREVGVATETWQELAHAGKIAGVEGNQLSNALLKVQRNAAEAADTGIGPAAEALDFLGIKSKEFVELSPDQMLETLADRFNELPPSAQRTAAAMDLLGKSGPKLFSMFEGGGESIRALRAEAVELGMVIDHDAAVAMEKWNDTSLRLRSNLDGFKTQLVIAVLPALQGVADRMLDWFAANRAVIKQRLDAAVRKVGKAVEWMHKRWVDVDKFVQDRIGGWDVVLRAIGSAIISGGIVSGFFKLKAALALLLPIATKLMAIGAIALIKFIIIGAIIAGLALGIEDLITGLQGGESYTKDFLDAWTGTDTVFGKVIDWFKSALRVGESMWEFLSVALPLAFETLWTIVGPILSLLWDGIKEVAALLFGELGDSLDDGSTKLEKLADFFDAATTKLKASGVAVQAWAEKWRGRVKMVTDVIRKLAEWIGKLPLDKLASAASTALRLNPLTNPTGMLKGAAGAISNMASSISFGDTNVSTSVQTGASADEIAAANAKAVGGVQRKALQLAYARNEGGPR